MNSSKTIYPATILVWFATACLWIVSFFSLILVSVNTHAQPYPMTSVSTVNAHQLANKTDTWIHMQGSNTVGERLTPAIAKAFLESKGVQDIGLTTGRDRYDKFIQGYDPKNDRYVQIRIESYGSSTGFKGLMAGAADMSASSRPIKQKEVEKLKEMGNMTSQQAEHVVGIDGLAMLVHPSNPVTSLTVKQIAELFSGQVKNWQEVGGPNLAVSLHARDHESGTWDTFKGLVLAKKYKLDASAKRYVSNDALSQQVSEDVGAIGFSGLSSVGNSKLLAVADGDNAPALYPTRLTVGTEDYPLARRLFLYTPVKDKKAVVDEFIQFALSSQGQKLVDEIGYISQNIESHTLAVSSDLPEYYRQAVAGADRLSLNFRFKEGKSTLDNKAFVDVKRLAEFMNTQGNEQKSVVLVGASDPRSKDENAVLLSKLRAKVVRRELIDLGIPRNRIKMVANGALLQVADNSSLTSRIKNRRVEVWLQ